MYACECTRHDSDDRVRIGPGSNDAPQHVRAAIEYRSQMASLMTATGSRSLTNEWPSDGRRRRHQRSVRWRPPRRRTGFGHRWRDRTPWTTSRRRRQATGCPEPTSSRTVADSGSVAGQEPALYHLRSSATSVRGTQSLGAVAATLSMESDLAIDGQSQFVAVEVASAHYADVFGVRLSLGRWFVNDREPVAVISDAIGSVLPLPPGRVGARHSIWDRFVHDRRTGAAGIHRCTCTAPNRFCGCLSKRGFG